MHGKNRIGLSLSQSNGSVILSYDPRDRSALPGKFRVATDQDIENALTKAEEAFGVYRSFSGAQKADFLEAIADEILAPGDELIRRASLESALPEGRIAGERGRTVGQLKLFASLLREGSWVDASIDTAIPDREPLPKADIRKMSVPVGPVVVFTASNFPLAFSTAGGDTASALAAGNPVIVKAHESHLGTNELIADAIARAAQKTGMPDGVFSSLTGNGFDLGQKLVQHPKTKSVAFTGSYRGGKALYDLAQTREEPIPVFSEMGSINPVFLLPGKLENEAASLARTYAGSITLGVGQFCTNPGLIIGIGSAALDEFSKTLSEAIGQADALTMLNPGIARAYQHGLEEALSQKGVATLSSRAQSDAFLGTPAVAKVTASAFVENPTLAHEVFGPFSLVVECEDRGQLKEIIQALKGQLTATFMASESDSQAYKELISQMADKCGRLIFNGVPTGVEVCHGMHHGGPFPAATDSRFTSVGTDAIKRFVKPLCFQDAPGFMLPDELKDENPLGIFRKVNGQMTKDKI